MVILLSYVYCAILKTLVCFRANFFSIFCLSILLLLYSDSALGQNPTNLQAANRNGQTFLTWNEIASAGASYRVYRSTEPIVNASQLTDTNRLGTVGDRSSFNERLSEILSDTTTYYVIQTGTPALTESQGLFVHTTNTGGNFYYAVTSFVNNIENTVLTSGQNTLSSAVSESVSAVQPVFQRTFTNNARTYESYVHWTTNVGNANYPAMANRASFAFNFGLQKRGTASIHSLLISLHARGGNFVNGNGTSDANEWVLSLDDYIPNEIRNTFWYGYHENFDLSTGLGFPTTGTVPDYTVRRAKWTIEWVLNTQPIDQNRVYMMGGSMGGIGSFFLSLKMPDRIAAIYMVIPKFDFSFLTDPNPANIWNAGSPERQMGDRLWSATDVNLPSSDGIPIYDRLNGGVMVANLQATSLPIMIAFNGKNDTIVGWAEKIGFYNSMNLNRHGGMFFFDSRPHQQGGIREWSPQQNPSILNRFRLNQSYPAFSNSSANGNPGNGVATNGDVFGTLNGNLGWDETAILDTAERFEITVKTVSLQSTNGTVAAPNSATANITPRRLQNFRPASGQVVNFENRDQNGQVIQQGQVTVDALGLITVPQFTITPNGNKLILTRQTTQLPPSLASVQFFRSGRQVSRPIVGDTTKPYQLNIFGSSFSNQSVVLVNGIEVSTTFVNDSELNAKLPAGRVRSVGNLSVQVRNADGQTSVLLTY